MKLLAPNLYQIPSLYPYAFNAYYIDTPTDRVIVDASIRWAWPMFKRHLRGTSPTAVLLTHAHPDHQGCAKKLCARYNAPLLCHEADAESAEGRAPLVRQSPFWEFIGNVVWAGPRSPVSRQPKEGDTIAGFTVYHLPGHTPGHIILFRESDRVAIIGDVLNTNDHIMGLIPYLREPPAAFSLDPQQNRDAIRRLASLNPSLLCPGHGPPWRDMDRLAKFVARIK